MSLPIKSDLHKVDADNFDYIYEENATIKLRDGKNIVRCNVFRPKGPADAKYPVLVTYGPYGRDTHYSIFHASSFAEVSEEHHSPHSAWETPDPGYWTRSGYALVRADEVGLGQSPGALNTMSRDTSIAFVDVIEWAAEQTWSTGKVGLLGISYYAGSQWRVAARKPKGLACMIPWEGMSDYYRDRCRHGGILSNTFIDFWWNRQVTVNQYGRKRREGWGPETIEGTLPEDFLHAKCHDQNMESAANGFLDDEYYASRDYDMSDIEVPLLSVGNWGGIMLHLRGNVEDFMNAGSKQNYLRIITGRHDLPFYTADNPRMSNRARTHSIQPPRNGNAKMRVRGRIRFEARSIHLGLRKVCRTSPRFAYVVEQSCFNRSGMEGVIVGRVVVKIPPSQQFGVWYCIAQR